MAVVRKKVLPKYFDDIISGKKKFELRLGDFEIAVGDTLMLEEWDHESRAYTGRTLETIVTYRLTTKDLSFWSAEEIAEHGFQIIQFKLKDPERPKVGLGVVILKEGKVLLSKRRNAHGEGSWAFPGGHLEFGESWEDCAKRETFEETGIAIKNIRFGRATNDVFEAEQKHYITLYMVADYDSGEVVNKEPDKSEVWEWFAWDALPQPLFLPIQHLTQSGFRPVDSV